MRGRLIGRWTLPALLVAVAFALAAAGCGGSSGSSTSGSSASGGSTIAPASSALYFAIDTDLSSGQLDTAQTLLDKFPGKDKLLNQLRTSLEDQTKLSWEKDVKPALGDELDVVVLDLSANPDVVGLIQPHDEAAFARVVEKSKTDPSNQLYVADYKGWKVFSDSQAAVDRFKREAGAGTLADDSTFTDAVGALSDESLVRFYANGPKATEALKRAFSQSGVSGLGGLASASQLVFAAAELVAEDDGVRLDGTIRTKGSESAKPYKAALPSEVPAGALAYISFNGESIGSATRKQLDQALNTLAAQVPGGALLVPLLRPLGPILGHENALYVRPGTPLPEVTLVTTPDAPAQAMTTVDQLVSGFAGAAGASAAPRPVTIGGVQAKQLDLGRFSIFYGATGKHFVVSDVQKAFEDLQGTGTRLADDATFKEALAAAAMPDETNGFVYISLKDSIPLLESLVQLGGTTVPAEVNDNLRPLRTFVAWSGNGSGQGYDFTAFLEIK